jgi:hypothetical protein
MCKESHVNLIDMCEHVGNNRNHTENKGDAKKDWQGIKVDAIFFAERAEIGVHEIIHINIIILDYIFWVLFIILLFLLNI